MRRSRVTPTSFTIRPVVPVPSFLVHEGQHGVFRIRLRLAKTGRQALRAGQALLSFFGKTVDVHQIPPRLTTGWKALQALVSKSRAQDDGTGFACFFSACKGSPR